MKARGAKSAPSADLLVCFPPRAHLALMPKPICSPARPSEPTKRSQHRHNLKRAATRGGSQASPLLWSRNKQLDYEMIAEPTSPKVTCAGQIKVRPGTGNSKSWQSVMEEIGRIHSKSKKKPSWVESLGFKKDVFQFLACLRSIRFDFRCFGAFPQSDIVTDDDDEGEEEEELFVENNHAIGDNDESSGAAFSKWFMVLQENQNDACRKEQNREKQGSCELGPAVPPPNALLLMRCRSAPAKSWMKEKEEDGDEDNGEEEEENREEECREKRSRNLRSLLDEEKENVKENLVVMKYGAGLCKISTDISKETWLVGGRRDPLSRSRSWRR